MHNLPKNAVKNIKSVPSKPLSGSPSAASVSIARIVKGLGGVLIFSGYKSDFIIYILTKFT